MADHRDRFHDVQLMAAARGKRDVAQREITKPTLPASSRRYGPLMSSASCRLSGAALRESQAASRRANTRSTKLSLTDELPDVAS
jgi:hypothetical protein